MESTNLKKQHLIQLHFIVFIYGFTGILGRLITLDAIQLVWYRMLIAAATLGIIFYWKKMYHRNSWRSILLLLGTGFIVAFHWITFFHAIKISTISVALGCLASTTLFTSFLEPAFFRRKVSSLEVITGIVIFIGLYAIFQFEPEHLTGIITALLSAFLAALFTVINKVFIRKYDPVTISFYEMSGGFFAISLLLLINGTYQTGLTVPTPGDWLSLLILGVVCTAFAYMASVNIMKTLSAYTVVLAINLEPVYGIIMAYFIFGDAEKMSAGFYVGTMVILTAVFMFPVIKRKGLPQKS